MDMMSFRFDKKMQEELEFIRGRLHTTKTAVVKKAIHLLYGEIKRKKSKKTAKEVLKESDMIGFFEGERNLSLIYKDELKKKLDRKYGK